MSKWMCKLLVNLEEAKVDGNTIHHWFWLQIFNLLATTILVVLIAGGASAHCEQESPLCYTMASTSAFVRSVVDSAPTSRAMRDSVSQGCSQTVRGSAEERGLGM